MKLLRSFWIAPFCLSFACSVQLGGGADDPAGNAPARTPASVKKADARPAPRPPVTREVFRGQLTFTPGMLVVDAKGGKMLDELAALLKAHPEYTRIVSEGHCSTEKGCCTTAAECQSNDPPQLANWRANVTRNQLGERGIDPKAVDYEHKGFGHIGGGEAAAAKQRRVEIIVYGP